METQTHSTNNRNHRRNNRHDQHSDATPLLRRRIVSAKDIPDARPKEDENKKVVAAPVVVVPTAHPKMAKVERAGNRIPKMATMALGIYENAITSLPGNQIVALAQHLNFHHRKQSTIKSLAKKVRSGTVVRIMGGDARYIGKSGLVIKAGRLRCHVAIAGVEKRAYLFNSDVIAIVNEQKAS